MSRPNRWRIRYDREAKGWRGLVLVPGSKQYRSRTFDSRPEAEEWAQEEADQIRVGRAPPVTSPSAVLTEEAAGAYCAELASLGRAPSTLRDLATIFAGLAAAVPRLDAGDAGTKTETWLSALRTGSKGRGGGKVAGRPFAPARRNKYLLNVRALCRWAMRRRGLLRDPTEGIRMAQVDQPLKPQFSVSECSSLLSGDDSKTRRWVALLLLAGLRSDEARTLRWGDIDWPGGVLLIRLGRGRLKRGRERIVPIQCALRAILEPVRGKDEGPICGLSAGNLRARWLEYLTARSITLEGRSPHSCRHTYAGLLTATGEPTALVGAYLGHSSAQTTLGYVRLAARFSQDPEVKGWPRGELLIIPPKDSP